MIAPLQVSVDIFKGFPDEESIVNYTLNQAYQDNVTVFASECLSLLPQGPPSPTDLCPQQLSPTLSLLFPQFHVLCLSLLHSLLHFATITLRTLALPHALSFSPAPPFCLSHYHPWSAHSTVCRTPSVHTLWPYTSSASRPQA